MHIPILCPSLRPCQVEVVLNASVKAQMAGLDSLDSGRLVMHVQWGTTEAIEIEGYADGHAGRHHL